jgi:hypothetical protein
VTSGKIGFQKPDRNGEMNLYIRRHAGRLGHMCWDTNVDIINADGKIVGYATPEVADWLVRQGIVMDVTEPTDPTS